MARLAGDLADFAATPQRLAAHQVTRWPGGHTGGAADEFPLTARSVPHQTAGEDVRSRL